MKAVNRNKMKRQAAIMEIIDNNYVGTQQELKKRLKEIGYPVTTATVSRDIQELKLLKAFNFEGQLYYSLSRDTGSTYKSAMTVLKNAVLLIDYADKTIVIKTLPGMAPAAAMVVDSMNWSEVIGTIAGDDTVFVMVRNTPLVEGVVSKMRSLLR